MFALECMETLKWLVTSCIVSPVLPSPRLAIGSRFGIDDDLLAGSAFGGFWDSIVKF